MTVIPRNKIHQMQMRCKSAIESKDEVAMKMSKQSEK